ncbi:MAG: hypothetical protein WKF84_10535 [Pyrinomonadaceae bacterium]
MPRRNYLPFKIVLVSSVLIFIIATGLAVWLVHQVSQPPARRYVVTPREIYEAQRARRQGSAGDMEQFGRYKSARGGF